MSAVPPNEASGRMQFRHVLKQPDAGAIRDIVVETGMFKDAEVDVALELVHENLKRGDDSGYLFAVAEMGEEVVGYACYGLIPCTVSSYDLYWIAVHPSSQGGGIGRRLMDAAEDRIRAIGGTRVYVETSGRDAYLPTRRFYERLGYTPEAALPDFYAPGDPKVIYRKALDHRTGG